MTMIESTMLKLGTSAPDFNLPDVAAEISVELNDFDGKKALLVVFLSAHCPYVKHVAVELGKLTSEYMTDDVGVVGIGANDVKSYPEDSPKSLAKFAKKSGWQFPVLYDKSQETAKAYRAACTPDFFLFDEYFKLAYRGQMDSSRPGNEEKNDGADLRKALDIVLAGQVVTGEQIPSSGCNIKWVEGNEPEYFK